MDPFSKQTTLQKGAKANMRSAELEPAQFLIPQSTYAKCTLVCDVETGTSVLRDQVLSANFALNLRSGKHTTYRVSIYGDLSIKIEKDGI